MTEPKELSGTQAIIGFAALMQEEPSTWYERIEYFNQHTQEWTAIGQNYLPDFSSIKYRVLPKVTNINGFLISEPVRTALATGQKYYVPALVNNKLFAVRCWNGERFCFTILHKGIIHLSPEAAIMHAKALLSFTGVSDESV